MKIYCLYEEKCVFSESDFNPEDYSGSSESHYESKLKSTHKRNPNTSSYWKDVELYGCESEQDLGDFSPVFVVVVKYSTGDTFGHSTGHIHFFSAHLDEKDAQAICKRIQSGDEMRDFEGYCPWLGYFERLESCYVQTEMLKP